MSSYYFDTSALLKNYHAEDGTLAVARIVAEPEAECFISRLAVTEVQRTFAQLARRNELSADEAAQVRGSFYTDLRARRFRVMQIKTYHHHTAARLFYHYLPQRRLPLLRTADAIQLAAALRLRDARGLDFFVAADEELCAIARAENLSVINPTD